MSSFIEGLIAGYGIAVAVGAIAILIVNMSMGCGFKIGFMAGAGAATADLFYAILATVAGTALIAVLGPVASQLRVISGLVLIGLGGSGLWRGLKCSSQQKKTAEVCGPLRMYAQFLGITMINPLTVVYFTAFILGRDPCASINLGTHLPFAIGVGLASLSWQTLLAAVGGIAHDRLTGRFQLLAAISGNLLIVFFGVRILLAAFHVFQ